MDDGAPATVVVDTRRRVLAFIIDMALLVPFCYLAFVGFFSGVLASFPGTPEPGLLASYGWCFAGLLGALMVQGLNRGVIQGRTGKSLGKRIMKISVVRLADGRPAGAWWGLLRVLLEQLAGVIDVVVAFVTDRRQRLGDMAANTVVLDDEDIDSLLR
jgi:uncharacterized RDD family membrane protein YckC